MSNESSVVLTSEELDKINDKKITDAITCATKLSERAVFNPKEMSNDGLFLNIIDKVPFLTDLLSKIDGTGNAVINLVEVTGHVSTTIVGMTRGLQIAGIVLDSFNVIRIPFVYLASAMLGKKPPITLSNNAQWFYSVVLLSLAIVALTVPVTAPFIAIAASSLVSLVGLFTLGRLYYQRYQAEKMVKRLNEDMNPLINELNELQTNAEAAKNKFNLPLTQPERDCVVDQINELHKKFDDGRLISNIQAKYMERSQYIAFLEKENRIEVLDKVVGITFSALAVLAALVALVFPPAALGILIGTGAVGSGYTVARILGALFSKSVAPQSLVVTSLNPEITMTNAELEEDMKREQEAQKEQKEQRNSSYNVTKSALSANNTATKEQQVQDNTLTTASLLVGHSIVCQHDTAALSKEEQKNPEQSIAIACQMG